MDVAELAWLEHANMVEADVAAAGQVDGAIIQRGAGIALLSTGLPMRLFNQVIVEDERATTAAIEAAVTVMRQREARFVVTLRAGTDDRHLAAMAGLGLVVLDADPWMPGMAMSPIPPPGERPPVPGLDIRQVTDAEGIADHIAAAAGGFDMPIAWLEAIITEGLVAHPDAALYVGYAAGSPVCAGLGFRTGRTIGVYNIATVEPARRRGYGAAMTMRIVDDGLARGCDVATLQASPMGRPIYERLGFRTVVDYRGFIDLAST